MYVFVFLYARSDFYTCVSRDNTVDTRSIRTADLRPFSENDQLYVIEIRSNSFTSECCDWVLNLYICSFILPLSSTTTPAARNTVIGDDSVFNSNGIEYANPRLDGNTDYYFFLRQLSQIDVSYNYRAKHNVMLLCIYMVHTSVITDVAVHRDPFLTTPPS